MKKIIITGFAFAALLSSCGEVENKIEAEAAKEVKKEEVKSTTVEYSTVKEGSVVNWLGSHLGGVGAHNGTVTISEATLTVTDNKLANADFTLDMTSIKSIDLAEKPEDHAKLVGHLSNEDFFNVASFANANFALTSIEAVDGGEYNSKVTGNLTILGVDKSITFNSDVNIGENEVTIASEKFTIDRTQWGNEFNKEGTEGMPTDYIISNNITVSILATVTK